jgi:hypothetical protein
LRGLPPNVIERIRSQSTSYGGSGGQIDVEASNIAAAINDISSIRSTVADTLRSMSAELRSIRTAVRSSGLQREAADLQLASTTADRLTNCAVSAVEAASGKNFGGAIAETGLVCANAGVQIGIAARLADIAQEEADLAVVQRIQLFEASFANYNTSLSERLVALRSALLRIGAAIIAINALQAEARSAVGRALLLDNSLTDRALPVNTASRGRYNTALTRYNESHRRAVAAAWIARVALEQRLGMNLDTMVEDLVTVDAPSGWANQICDIPSIDYDNLRGGEYDGPDGYAGLYLGDYVRRLEQVFESYSFAYPFQAGTDTAVISMRDDVFRSRSTCETSVPNVLARSNELDAQPSGSVPGWALLGCNPAAVPPGVLDRGCVGVDAIETGVPSGAPVPPVDAVPPGTVLDADNPRPRAFRLRFGGPAATPSARLAQTIALEAGNYRVSWYTRPTPGAPVASQISPHALVRVEDLLAGGELYRNPRALDADMSPSTSVGGPYVDAPDGGWSRYFFYFSVPTARDVRVVLSPRFPGGIPTTRTIDVAGLALERVNDLEWSQPATSFPNRFVATTASGLAMLPVCEDLAGQSFRANAWVQGCTRVCPDGYDGNCDPAIALQRCYREATFSISSDALSRALVGSATGFAGGNHNYRIDSIAVNLVGTALRDCSASTGSTCYGSGNLSYSIIHSGEFPVRNARGELYSAPLFTGRIETARALAAERYITNPISPADRALIEPYTRLELRGRPLGGSFTVRLWDDDGFQFDRLEDVQVVLNYRYWTPQR